MCSCLASSSDQKKLLVTTGATPSTTNPLVSAICHHQIGTHHDQRYNSGWTFERMQQLEAEGRLIYTKSGMPQYKRYLDESEGTPLQSVWTDIPPVNSQAARLPNPETTSVT
jgi:hypothetical protein